MKYTSKKGECNNNFKRPINISSYSRLHDSDCALKDHLVNIGPASALICATENFTHYKNGVFDEQNCQQNCEHQFNHAVLVVGYGKDYWLIKNSWGTSWGYEVCIQNIIPFLDMLYFRAMEIYR